MLEAIIISILVAIALSLISILILKIIDARDSSKDVIYNDVAQLEARDYMSTKTKESSSVGDAHKGDSSSSISKRITGFGVAIAAIFGILGAKLASLQIADNKKYIDAAKDNQFKIVRTPAARGKILDRHGKVLAHSENIQVIVAEKDVADNEDVLKRLSAVLGIPIGILRLRCLDSKSGAQSRRVLCSHPRNRDIAFIFEHKDAFPGVFVESRFERVYDYGALAAHALGYTGSPTEEQIAKNKDSNITLEDTIGMSGIEAQYDNLLRGDTGQRNVMVDADGNIIESKDEIDPMQGSDIMLTLDAHAQYIADHDLYKTIIEDEKASTGAVVCMDLETGGIVAMASYPTYDPNSFVSGIPQDTWNLYSAEESRSPMLNRTISSTYAPGSTMKAFSAMAALEYGFTSADTSYYCSGSWDGWDTGLIQKCWQTKGHGTIDLHRGIVVSCDVVFYEIAKAFYDNGPAGSNKVPETAYQEYVKKFNLGKRSKIDLNDEVEGVIPTPEWKAERWRNVPQEASFVAGDYSNMAIGQGYVLLSPIQLAVGYCGMATGKLLKPHLLNEIKNASGDTVRSSGTEELAPLEVNEIHREFVCNALHDMVSNSTVINRLATEAGIDMAGKTGTAEHSNEIPDALFVGYAPYDNPKYVCVSVMQHGNSGEQVASQVVVDVLKAAIESDENPDLEVGRVAGYAGEKLIDGRAEGESVRE